MFRGVDLRAKPKPRAQSARKLRAKREPRAKPKIKWEGDLGRGSVNPSPKMYVIFILDTVQFGVYEKRKFIFYYSYVLECNREQDYRSRTTCNAYLCNYFRQRCNRK